ncbi:MAG TPA: ATP-binding protein [Candidatus Saccharimonadaceae bacterium]|jgi:signal transduction histidine kinase|nr:ATP-binding protein [Candidatus Saccharimonadaceae bacterium]
MSPEDLSVRCRRVFREYVERRGEAALHDAYELGRRALDDDSGITPFVAAIQQTLLEEFERAATPGEREGLVEAAGAFLLEALSPFDLAHRGARDSADTLRRMSDTREHEVRRVAQDLHDSAVQHVAAARLALDETRRALPNAAREPAARATRLLLELEDHLRRISHELRPALLDDLGLAPALRAVADGFARRHGLDIRIETAWETRLPGDVELALYRIVHEALFNVARHARARHVVIRLEPHEGGLCCSVRDDGVGFDAWEAARRGLGLRGMRERAAGIRGRLEIAARPGGGAELSVLIPLGAPHAASAAAR